MEKSDAAKLAKILNILVLIAFVCNLAALPLVPGLVGIASEGGLRYFADFVSRENLSAGAPAAVTLFFMVCWQFLWRIWRTPHTAAIAAFLMVCGVCTAGHHPEGEPLLPGQRPQPEAGGGVLPGRRPGGPG